MRAGRRPAPAPGSSARAAQRISLFAAAFVRRAARIAITAKAKIHNLNVTFQSRVGLAGYLPVGQRPGHNSVADDAGAGPVRGPVAVGAPAGWLLAATRGLAASMAAATRPAPVNSATMRARPWRNVPTGSPGTMCDRIATRAATPSTVPI